MRVPLDEAARLEGLSLSTLYRWRKRGLIDSFRSPAVDRRTYVDLEQVRAIKANPPLERMERS